MANGEWLTQLLSGLGGAFTGEVAARGRMAEEQEMQRKMQEQQAEKERQRRILQLRGGPMSEAAKRELLTLGETPTNISALRDMFTPKTEPTYTVGDVPGAPGFLGTFKNGRFTGQMRQRPSADADRKGLTPTQRSQGIGFLTSYFAEPGQTPEEKMRRSQLFTSLQQQYEDPSELGYALMQSERSRRKPPMAAKRMPSLDDL